MNHPKPIRIIDLAIKGACIRIGELQKEIILIEAFGNKAMIDPGFYHPENLKRNESLYNLDEIKREMDGLIQLAEVDNDFPHSYLLCLPFYN